MNIQNNSAPLNNSLYASQSDKHQGRVQNNSYIGFFIKIIRSCSSYIIPATQAHERTERLLGEQERLSVHFSFLEAMKNYGDNILFHPEDYMTVNKVSTKTETDPFQMEFESFISDLNVANQLLSITALWNFICSLNPYYIAPINATLTKVDEQTTIQDSFSIGHFVALICAQVSTRSQLPKETHWLLNSASNYIITCSNIKAAQDIYFAFKAKCNEREHLNHSLEAVSKNEEEHDDCHEDHIEIISLKFQKNKIKIEEESECVFRMFNLIFNQQVIKDNNKLECQSSMQELISSTLSINNKLIVLKTKYEQWIKNDKGTNAFSSNNERRTLFFPDYAQFSVIEKLLYSMIQKKIYLQNKIYPRKISPLIFEGDALIHPLIIDHNLYRDMPDLEN